MNQDIIKGKWNEVKGQVKAKWAELTDDDLNYIDGRMTELAGRLQQRYGWEKARADSEADEFLRRHMH